MQFFNHDKCKEEKQEILKTFESTILSMSTMKHIFIKGKCNCSELSGNSDYKRCVGHIVKAKKEFTIFKTGDGYEKKVASWANCICYDFRHPPLDEPEILPWGSSTMIDPEIREFIREFDKIDDSIYTLESCAGHVHNTIHIWFRCDNNANLNKLNILKKHPLFKKRD